MEDSTAEKLKSVIEPQINRHSGNIMLMVGSSECGKSTMLAKVLLPIFSKSNGFMTTFMSHSYDSLPIQQMIVDALAESSSKKKKLSSEIQNYVKTGAGHLNFKIEDLYKVKEWILTKRGFDKGYCEKIYGMRRFLNKKYGESEKVREFRFVLALDDEIDIGGSLIRKVCLTWRNLGISWIQLVQDITCLDCAVRNSAPLVFFGYMNFPHRREQIVRGYLEPYLEGGDVREKMNTYMKLTENKCFIFMNHRLRKAFHLNTQTGDVRELEEVGYIANPGRGPAEKQDTQRFTKDGMDKPFDDPEDSN